MKSMETDSPAPYIALGVIEKGELPTEPEENSRSTIVWKSLKYLLETLFTVGLVYVCVMWIGTTIHKLREPMKVNLTVIHKYEQPEWAKTPYPDPDYADAVWEDNFDIQEYIEENGLDPLGEPMYVTEYEELKEMKEYYPDERIADVVFQMCDDIYPEDWTYEWKTDPQLWTQKMREDIDFCNMIFSGFNN